MSFRVSVVIPVYNAAGYVREAVNSCLIQPQVHEVILVEDKSPDNSLEVCRQLALENSKVKLLQHSNGENRGAGASRNLGIQSSSGEYVSFLDADDYFLPQRFNKTEQVFLSHPDADGVYDAIAYFYDGQPDSRKLFTVSRPLEPSSLFHYLLRGTYGHFSTIGVTVKRDFFDKTGFFDTSLRLHQDTEMWLRMSHFGKLYAGELTEPVAMARRHPSNRISTANYKTKLQYWEIVRSYYRNRKIGIINRFLITRKIAKLRSVESRTGYFGTLIKEIF